MNVTGIQVEKVLQSLQTTFVHGLENGDFGENSKQSKQIQQAAESIFLIESSSQMVNNIVLESTTYVELAKEKKKLAEYRRNFGMDQNSAARFAAFSRELENLRVTNSEENEANERHRIDPISKKPIKFPVKNIRCGHLYDKKSICEAIRLRGSANLRCPYLGCTNKRVVLDDLVEDNDANPNSDTIDLI